MEIKKKKKVFFFVDNLAFCIFIVTNAGFLLYPPECGSSRVTDMDKHNELRLLPSVVQKKSFRPALSPDPSYPMKVLRRIVNTKQNKTFFFIGIELNHGFSTLIQRSFHQKKFFLVLFWTVEIAQLWQHNRGNYTTPTIYQKNEKKKKMIVEHTLGWLH